MHDPPVAMLPSNWYSCSCVVEHYPYLLVNIGSGVSMVRVDGESKFQRVSGVLHGCLLARIAVEAGRMTALLIYTRFMFLIQRSGNCGSAGTNIGGGTFWGLCKLLTGMDNFDDILSLSSQGDNSNVSATGHECLCMESPLCNARARTHTLPMFRCVLCFAGGHAGGRHIWRQGLHRHWPVG